MCAQTLDSRKTIYLDFETNMSDVFYLVGHCFRDDFEQVVLDSRLRGLARHKRLVLSDPASEISRVLERAVRHSAPIVAYSLAEKNTIERVSKSVDFSRYTDVQYVNLRKAARTWIRRHRKHEFDALPAFRSTANAYQKKRLKNSLASVMRLTNYQAPSDYAPGFTTRRFDAVMRSLEQKDQDYSRLTPVQKSKATKALKHNAFDVKALSFLFNVIWETDPRCFDKCVSVVALGEGE